ncbi:MAG TPA: aldo/keto reductase [Gammaproteobacteria bacterium]|nr:aldo/keto reductase [Gammaproteobacteria bacterium]
MQQRYLCNTQIAVSRLGLGTVKFGRNQGVKYPEAFALPSDQDLLRLLDSAAAWGINLLDTAPAYGNSEERLGKLLQGKRQQWVIATKAGEEFINGESHFDFSPVALQHSVEHSLLRLHTDYLDVVLIHSNGEDERLIEQEGVFDTLARLKKDGKIRVFGMSTKTVAGGLRTVEEADVVMVTYNPFCRDDQAVIAAAHQQGKGVLVKKALASGHLEQFRVSGQAGHDAVKTALQFVLAEAGVSSLVLGTINVEHLREAVEVVMAMS